MEAQPAVAAKGEGGSGLGVRREVEAQCGGGSDSR